MSKLKNKKVLVLGLGLSGRAATKFLLKREAIVTGIDQNLDLLTNHSEVLELIQNGLTVKHESESLDVTHFDLVVVSPGVPPTNPYYIAAHHLGVEIIGEIELACCYSSGIAEQTFIAVTGTNGKTTTTLMIAHILNNCGKTARAVGNVGTPLTSELDSSEYNLEGQILVIELSSFQLETLNEKIIDVGVILNISPDHLDRYPNTETYAASKLRLKDCLKPKGILYIFEPTYKEFKYLLNGFKPLTYGYHSSCDLYTDKKSVYFEKNEEFFLPEDYRGKESHDVENTLAAYALCKEMGVTPQQFLKALATFKKPSHRLEFVRSFKDVAYYDDSKGTNIDAVIRAVNALDSEVILIAGGVDKGAAYTPWISAFAGRVKCVFAIGQAAIKIKKDLSSSLPVKERPSLEAAVKDAMTIAKPGQVVLLSPGCSSFDMFRDYAHRGEEFKRIVNTLEEY